MRCAGAVHCCVMLFRVQWHLSLFLCVYVGVQLCVYDCSVFYSQVLGPLFEPYFVPTIDLVLSGIGDGTSDVKQAAVDASQTLMKSLSGVSL